ncbi:hypothetical protein LPJ74_000960 [Coemansia sp. RSA 1843]|nr:hypothetical protein LPJ74_000960 [Coemansia sp. RSA 1843]
MSVPQARQRQRQAQQQRQQQQQQQQQLNDNDQERIRTWLSTVYADDVLRIVQHFGDCPSATDVRVLDVDANGVTVAWKSKEEEKQEMQFAFRQPSGAGSVLQEISDLASDASKALGLTETPQIAKDIETLNARTLVNFAFVLPSLTVMVAIVFGVSMVGYLALVEDIHPWLEFTRSVVSQGTWYFILVVTAAIHALEALLTFVVCQLIKTFQPRQMNTKMQIQWTAGSALFGIFCLHRFITKLRRQFELADSMKGPSLASAYGASGHAKTN